MKRFVEGTDRRQSTLFPECLEDWIDVANETKTAAMAIFRVPSMVPLFASPSPIFG